MTQYLSGFLAHSLMVIAFLSLILGIIYSIKSISEKEHWDKAYEFVKTNFLIFKSIIKSPIIYFDKNPTGTILNRFVTDIGIMDT